MRVVHALGHALGVAGSMTWEILWALVLGFVLAGVTQALVRRGTIVRLLGDDRPRTLAVATGLGVASSSCSYAAVALARTLFRKGASFTAAMVFEIASTNLVVELGIILALLLGWQFTLAEFVGGPLIIVLVAVGFRLVLRARLLEEAHRHAARGIPGIMEGHAAMDMSVAGGETVWRRLFSASGLTAVSHVFVMEWAAVLRDVAIGLVLAGAAAAWVPIGFWHHLFLTGHPLLAAAWGPIIGPAVSVLSFVCSIGNVPLAAALWNGGISFGGVVSFLFADLIIIPIAVIYRKYYGTRVMLLVVVTFYVAMVAAGYVVAAMFGTAGLVPAGHHAQVGQMPVRWDYTTGLNIVFLVVAAVLVVRFFRTGGVAMMKEMDGGPDATAHHHPHGAHLPESVDGGGLSSGS